MSSKHFMTESLTWSAALIVAGCVYLCSVRICRFDCSKFYISAYILAHTTTHCISPLHSWLCAWTSSSLPIRTREVVCPLVTMLVC